jgi:predicted dehydrogenase
VPADPDSRPLSSLRAGVVGTGFVGVVHVYALRLLGVDVAGIVGSSPERAAAKAIAPVYDSLEALLADDSVDVVHLTTPDHLHHPQTKQVLAAGKHVVCEKPLAMTSEESAELLALAEESGLVHCTSAADVEREDAPMETEDIGHVLVRFDGGARGTFKVSQGAAGRKNYLHFEVDGSEAALALERGAPRGALARATRRAERRPPAERRADAPGRSGAHVPARRPRGGLGRDVPRAVSQRLRRGRRGRAAERARLPDVRGRAPCERAG